MSSLGDTSDGGEQFLLTDFQGLHEARSALSATTNSEINVFLLIVSAFAFGMGLISDFRLSTPGGLLLIISIGSAIMGSIGYATLYRTINARVQIYTYVRDMNRIRRYFVDKYPTIAGHAPPYIHDDKPSFLSISQDRSKLAPVLSNTFALVFVTSILLSISLVTFLASLIEAGVLGSRNQPLFLVLVGVATLSTAATKLIHKQTEMLAKAEEQAQQETVLFPATTKNLAD